MTVRKNCPRCGVPIGSNSESCVDCRGFIDAKEGFVSGMEAARRSGVSYRQVDYWARCGYVLPSGGAASPGSGQARSYAPEDVLKLTLLGRLARLGLRDLGACARMLEEFGTRGRFELIPGVIVDLERLVADDVEVPA